MVAWQHYTKLPDTKSNFKNKDYIRDKYYMTLNKNKGNTSKEGKLNKW